MRTVRAPPACIVSMFVLDFFYPKDPFQRLKKHSAPLTFEPVHTFHQNLSYSLYYLIVADNIHNL